MYGIKDNGMWIDENEKIMIDSQDLLVIIDGNNDFTKPWGALFVKGLSDEPSTEYVIQKIKYLFSLSFGYKALTDEAHCDNHSEFERFGMHCLIGSAGQKYHSDLQKIFLDVDERLMKGMDPNVISHSISTSPQFGSHLGNIKNRGIKRVFIVGWAFTHCVGDAGIAYTDQWLEKVYIVRDATVSVPPPQGDPELMTKKLKLNGVKFVLTNQLW